MALQKLKDKITTSIWNLFVRMLGYLSSELPENYEVRLIDETGGVVTLKQFVGATQEWKTVKPPASEILADLLTVDGADSGLDADKVDGFTSSAFLNKWQPSQTVVPAIELQREANLALANGGVHLTGFRDGTCGDLTIRNNTSGLSAVYTLGIGSTTTQTNRRSGDNTYFTYAKTSATTVQVYYEGDQWRIRNMTGGPITVTFGFVGATVELV